jgi:hypothetical protein
VALKSSVALLLLETGLLCCLLPGEDPPAAPPAAAYIVAPGAHIPLGLLNAVSTKHSIEGDRVYLQTEFPVLAGGRIVIPAGSYVEGTLTVVKRPERRTKDWHGKGRGQLFLRFDTLTLPNGVTRDFRARVSGVDGQGSEKLDRTEGKIEAEGDKAADARTVGETAAGGASIGLIAGSAAHHIGMGAGIGAAAGAAAGLMMVLLSRGPDVVLPKGSSLEMVTDRPISFEASDLDFGSAPPPHFSDSPAQDPAKKSASWHSPF